MKRTPHTRREQAEYVAEMLAEWGVRIDASSRIGRVLRAFRRPGIIEPDDPDYPVVIESIRDMYQLRLIVDTMEAHRGNRAFDVAANLLRKDLALPNNEDNETPGRDYQFQLYVAALCTSGGLATNHAEPDVTCVVGRSVIGIAVKRLKSMKALEDSVRSAADQIRRAGMPGMIALDLTLAQNPTNRRITSGLESLFHTHVSEAKTRDLFDKHGEKLRRIVDGKGVLTVWVFLSSLRVTSEREWTHDCWSFWFDTTEDEADEKILEEFRPAFLRGVSNLVDYSTGERG